MVRPFAGRNHSFGEKFKNTYKEDPFIKQHLKMTRAENTKYKMIKQYQSLVLSYIQLNYDKRLENNVKNGTVKVVHNKM